MGVPLEQLSSLMPGRVTRPREREIFAETWTRQWLDSDEVLWWEDDRAGGLGLLHKGELRASLRGHELGRIRPGELLGEITAFDMDARHGATIRATRPSEVLVLSPSALQDLGARAPDFHERLLDRSLEAVARRLRAVDLEIARLSTGSLPAPGDAPTPGWQRLVGALRETISPSACPDLRPLLVSLPVLDEAPFQVLLFISRGMTPRRFKAGELLVRQGEEGGDAFLVASGRVAVLRHVRGRRAEPLALLEPGDLLGAVSLVLAGRRSASCVAETDAWVYRMDQQAYRALEPAARPAWKACLLASLGPKLRGADVLMAELLQEREEEQALDLTG